MKKFFSKVLDWFVFLMTGKGAISDEMVDAGIQDLSGQGRDIYGR